MRADLEVSFRPRIRTEHGKRPSSPRAQVLSVTVTLRLLVGVVLASAVLTGCGTQPSVTDRPSTPEISAQQLPSTNRAPPQRIARAGASSVEVEYQDRVQRGQARPSDVLALGELYETSGRSAQALALYRNALTQRGEDVELLYRTARIYERSGDSRAALSWYERMRRAAPSDPRPVLGAAWILLASKREREALAILQRSRNQGLRSADAFNLEAEIRLTAGERDAASRLFRQALEIDASSFDALNGLGNLALEQGNVQQAQDFWRRAVSSGTRVSSSSSRDSTGLMIEERRRRAGLDDRVLDLIIGPSPEFAAERLQRAYALASDRDYRGCLRELGTRAGQVVGAQSLRAFCLQGTGEREEALAILLKQIAATEPKSSSFDLTLAGMLLLREGDVRRAQDLLEQATIATPKLAGSYAALAELHYGRESFTTALAAIDQAIALAPRDAQLLANRALILDRLGRRDTALVAYRQALQQTPVPSHARFNMGLLLLRTGRFGEAAEQFQALLSESDGDTEARTSFGYALARAGRTQEAETQWERVLSENPAAALAANNIGVLRARRGDHDGAVRFYQRAIQSATTPSSDYYHNLAAALVNAQRTEEAIEAYQQTLRLNSADIDAHHSLGALYLRDGDARNALRHLPVVVTARPDDPEPIFQLAVAYQLDGRAREARQFYTRFLELAEESPALYQEVIQAQAELRRLSL